ncbi:hypothetical protein J2X76_003949 [Neorhizobium sp. 2083]|uniref:hypothetical protein n=1 Tax=Neorhizobium sp. 2083 TaxID=2817762 RepID=UPI002854D04C|nr:hypothetical protein [Neorhizobium sp. 2083]MDR6818767.1 hypothetical protein [Neorhizobium sp. 2083]
MNHLVIRSSGFLLPAMVEALPETGRLKFLEFFTAQIHNPNTRCSYMKAAVGFLARMRGARYAVVRRHHADSRRRLD